MAKRKEWKHVIFSDDACQYDDYEKDYKADNPDGEYSWDMFNDDISLWLEAEQANLNWQIEGTIVAIASVGLWYGRRTGYKIVGDKLSDIFNVSYDCNEYYCDQDDCMARCAHHDGTNYITYRVFDGTEDEVDDLLYRSKDFKTDVEKHSHSLMPYIADIFGWKRDRRMKRGDMWNPRTYKSYQPYKMAA